uniref:Aminopeptidase N n=1 Tax=Aceria tosichella TaxID=561515 RepID=A0A6G1SC99_9ACAR
MSTQTKQQQRPSSDEVKIAVGEHKGAQVVTAMTTTTTASAADRSLTNEPNNNNNNHEKKNTNTNTSTVVAADDSKNAPLSPVQQGNNNHQKRDKQKLTTGGVAKAGAKLIESNGNNKNSDNSDSSDITGTGSLQTNKTSPKKTTKTKTTTGNGGGDNDKGEQQRDGQSSARMGNVISVEEESSSVVVEEPPAASPLRVVVGANDQDSSGQHAAGFQGEDDDDGNEDDPRRDNERREDEIGRRDRQPKEQQKQNQQQRQEEETLPSESQPSMVAVDAVTGQRRLLEETRTNTHGQNVDGQQLDEPKIKEKSLKEGDQKEKDASPPPTLGRVPAADKNRSDSPEVDKTVANANCHHHKALISSPLQLQLQTKQQSLLQDTKWPNADQLELGVPLDQQQHQNNLNLNLDLNHHRHIHRQQQLNNNNDYDDNSPLATYHYKPATTKRLSYLQGLLLRKWPCLPLTICIMTSLLFGILLSGLTIYLMHGLSDCSELASHFSATAGSPFTGAAGGSQHHLRHHSTNLLPHELIMDAPIEAASGAAGTLDGALPPELTHRQLTDAPSKAAAAAAAPVFQRLSGSVVPQHYELFIWPHIAPPSFHFNGSVEIRLTCKSPTNNITLHTLELDIDQASLRLVKLTNNTGTRLTRAATSSSSAPKVSRLSQDKQLQYSIIHLDSMLEPEQDYLLSMDFVGTLNDDLAGFYKIKYERQNSSEINWIAATQFQATDARRAFPCFDEPLYKATFGIRLKHWKNMTALSNMPIVNSEDSPDGLWITDTFAKSQRMSTYLVAFAVTNFESRTAGNITVWTRPGFVHTADYALSIAGKILRHYEDFFGIAYPLPKMDMIALPDFNAGAMENWGLITYRETAMLYDENSSSVANKQRVAVVVAHELAHQWFGNLVTPKWWDDLWLNEGFASFVEYIGVDHVEPKWRMLDQFVVDEVQNVFKLDGLSSSHQISIPVNNPDEISEIFDHISYAKGASIIRMMNHFLTDRVFKAGLQRYLRALKYSNAEQSDLWAHLTAAQQMFRRGNNNSNSNSSLSSADNNDDLEAIDVGKVMNSWTLQIGYPLVTLTRDYNKNTARLEQVRYQPYKPQEETSNSSNRTSESAQLEKVNDRKQQQQEQRWEIPITYTWKSEQNWQPTTRLWMRQNHSGPVEIPNSRDKQLVDTGTGLVLRTTTNSSNSNKFAQANEWMIVNVQQVGYYRVNYDLQNWKLLIAQLQQDHTKIGTTNRAQLLDDIFELAKSSLIDYQLAMEATKYLKMEREYLPWESVLLSFGYIDDMLLRTSIYGDWQDYFAQLIEPYYARYKDLDWTKPTAGNSSTSTSSLSATTQTPDIDANDVLEHYNQVNAVAWACAVNNQHCIDKAIAAFKNWKNTGVNNIRPALRLRTYSTAIEFGNKDDWDFLWRVYEKEQNASERDRILRALGCSRELWILSRYLEWTFSKTKPIRRQDGSFVFRVVAKNNHGRDIAFNFMRERWPIIKEYYGKSSFSLGSLIKSVATLMNTQLELDQLRAFYETIKGDVGTGKRSFQIAIEEVESNVYWRNRNYKILEKWLQEERLAASPK